MKKKKTNKPYIIGAAIVVLIIVIVGGYTLFIKQSSGKTISIDEARVKAVSFINKNLMQPGSEVSIKEVIDEGALYKVVVNMPTGQEIDSYLSKDGKLFFPQAMNIDEVEQATQEQEPENQEQPQANVPKQAKPAVELFVMSHCPYGTQIEKGILPVLAKLGESIDFELKFCDYAMHGKKEIDEQLTQYCIQKEEPGKLLTYLNCFLADESKSDECRAQANVSKTKIASCVAATDKEFKVTEMFNDKSTWRNGQFPEFALYKADNTKYGVTGSPSLVVNGTKISSGRSPATLLSTICNGFENPPEECNSELSAANPSPGFGFGTAADASAAECGN